MVNVGKYAIHGWYGYVVLSPNICVLCCVFPDVEADIMVWGPTDPMFDVHFE